MDNSVIKRLQDYCMVHKDLISSGIIKGINSTTNEIVLEKNRIQKSVSIDILENNRFDFDKFEIKEEVLDEEIESLEVNENINNNINIPKTIADLNFAIKEKNEKSIDKALETFAINEKTGVIDINKALSVVTNNAVKEVVECVVNNKPFDKNMTKYDITGKKIVMDDAVSDSLTEDEIKKDSFELLIIPFTEIAAMKGNNLMISEDARKNAFNRYCTVVDGKLALKGYKNEEKEASEETNVKNEVAAKKSYVPTLKPDAMYPMIQKKAGFADVFILTLIILIYAAIIINLILKLK